MHAISISGFNLIEFDPSLHHFLILFVHFIPFVLIQTLLFVLPPLQVNVLPEFDLQPVLMIFV